MPRPNDWMNESYMNIKEDILDHIWILILKI